MHNGVHNEDWATVTMGVARAYAKHMRGGEHEASWVWRARTFKLCRNDHGCGV